jgi:hypothetical protein
MIRTKESTCSVIKREISFYVQNKCQRCFWGPPHVLLRRLHQSISERSHQILAQSLNSLLLPQTLRRAFWEGREGAVSLVLDRDSKGILEPLNYWMLRLFSKSNAGSDHSTHDNHTSCSSLSPADRALRWWRSRFERYG